MAVALVKSRFVGGNLTFFDKDGNIIAYLDGTNRQLIAVGMTVALRRRNTVAELNAGAVTLLAAIPGWRYRLFEAKAISIGGAAGAVTTVDILGVQATASVKLAAFAQASLTQSTVLRPGIAGTTVLADGASFALNDVNTALTVSKTGASITVATHIDTDVLVEVVPA